jgi:hypothetical protein
VQLAVKLSLRPFLIMEISIFTILFVLRRPDYGSNMVQIFKRSTNWFEIENLKKT